MCIRDSPKGLHAVKVSRRDEAEAGGSTMSGMGGEMPSAEMQSAPETESISTAEEG